MDLSVKPGTDFYQFANGGWMKNNPLQAQYSRYGIFDRLGDTSLDQIRTIVNEAASMDQTQGGIPPEDNHPLPVGNGQRDAQRPGRRTDTRGAGSDCCHQE